MLYNNWILDEEQAIIQSIYDFQLNNEPKNEMIMKSKEKEESIVWELSEDEYEEVFDSNEEIFDSNEEIDK